MKRSTLSLAVVVPALALLMFAWLVPDGDEANWLQRFLWDPQERELYGAWARASGAAASLRLDFAQLESVEKAKQAAAADGGLRVLIEPDVGEKARRSVLEAVRRELDAIGASTPRYPVAIAMLRDTTQRWHYRRTVVLPREVGAPCTVVVRERGRSPAFAGVVSGDRVLGACAFYAAYGAPGAGMQDWLTRTRMRSASYLLGRTVATELETARSADMRPRAYSASQHVAACRAGRSDGCLRLFNAEEVDARAMFTEREPNFQVAGLASYDPNTLRVGEPMSATSYGLLGALAHDLGPAAFERIWTSDAGPAAAYEAETGDPLDTWVAQHVSGIVPEYHAGPLPPVGKLMLLTLLITVTAGGAIRFSRRQLS